MSELQENDSFQEMSAHLSTIQNSVDSTIQGLGNRNQLVRTSSSVFTQASKDLKDRLETLQKYSSSLCLKKKEMKNEIDFFYNNNLKFLNEIKQNKRTVKKQLESLEEKLTEISSKVAQNQQMKDEISNQVLQYNTEEENLDKKSVEYQELLSKPIPVNQNDEIIDSIQETQKSLSQVEEKIQSKSNVIDKYQSYIQAHQSLKNTIEKFAKTQEEVCLIQKKIELGKSISQEKQENIKKILSKIKENNDGIETFRNNLDQIKATNAEINQEKAKNTEILKSATPIKSELSLLTQEYDTEVKNEVELAREINEFDENLRNRDPEIIKIEEKMIELEEELRFLLQKKDDLLIIENSLQNEISNFDQKTLLMKEKISKEISEGAVFYEQKLYKELRALLNANDNMNKDMEELLMMINVLEAEKRRLYKKIITYVKKIEKYKEKEFQMKKLKSKSRHLKHKLNDLEFSIEATQFKINELICINEHKKEDIQTKKLSIEQTLLKFTTPPPQEYISKSNILNPIVPILNKRGESAKILSKTALYLKNMYLLQKNVWNDIDPNEIQSSFERWDEILEKTKPSIEKNILQAFIELVC